MQDIYVSRLDFRCPSCSYRTCRLCDLQLRSSINYDLSQNTDRSMARRLTNLNPRYFRLAGNSAVGHRNEPINGFPIHRPLHNHIALLSSRTIHTSTTCCEAKNVSKKGWDKNFSHLSNFSADILKRRFAIFHSTSRSLTVSSLGNMRLFIQTFSTHPASARVLSQHTWLAFRVARIATTNRLVTQSANKCSGEKWFQ